MYMAFNVDVRRGQQSTTRKNLTNDVEDLLEGHKAFHPCGAE